MIANTDVAELVDALDLGSSRISCEGSSPSIRILLTYSIKFLYAFIKKK